MALGVVDPKRVHHDSTLSESKALVSSAMRAFQEKSAQPRLLKVPARGGRSQCAAEMLPDPTSNLQCHCFHQDNVDRCM